MNIYGLFAGMGGFEHAFSKVGGKCVGLCEIEPTARAVLSAHFPKVKIENDIRTLKSLPACDILTAGFPCQDLSQAGTKQGISGQRSGLIDDVFRLLSSSRRGPGLVVLENVAYMLRLDNGKAIRHIISYFDNNGYSWAYRVLDARAFGLPHRRERVIFLASKKEAVENILFPEEYVSPAVDDSVGQVDAKRFYGFYWTEGKRGLGWTRDGVPAIKGGSTIGIPSPPAIWVPGNNFFGTPDIKDAESLFGFPADWSLPALTVNPKAGGRWKLVGNAVCVNMIEWLAANIVSPKGLKPLCIPLSESDRLPIAAYGHKGARYAVPVSTWPVKRTAPRLTSFLKCDMKPLSKKAALGFYSRAKSSTLLRFPEGFLDSMQKYISSLN